MAKDIARPTKNAGLILIGDSVRVWSEVGVTLPVGVDTYASFRFSFGHERISKNNTLAEVKRTAKLIDEFNSEELELRIEQYTRMIQRVLDGEDEPEPSGKSPSKSSEKGSVIERAKKRIK